MRDDGHLTHEEVLNAAQANVFTPSEVWCHLGHCKDLCQSRVISSLSAASQATGQVTLKKAMVCPSEAALHTYQAQLEPLAGDDDMVATFIHLDLHQACLARYGKIQRIISAHRSGLLEAEMEGQVPQGTGRRAINGV